MISIYKIIVAISIFPSLLFSMIPHNKQLEFCAARREYDKNYHSKIKFQANPVCPFCDEQSLSENFIFEESRDTDVRIMMNKFPYPDWQQGEHLLVMPLSHQITPTDFSLATMEAIQIISAKLYDSSLVQERWINWGKKFAGQSVDHIHEQFINFVKPAFSVTESIEFRQNSSISTVEEAFEKIRKKLDKTITLIPKTLSLNDNCLCCQNGCNVNQDKRNLIIARFQHNFVCLSQYPSFTAEISVVPYNHVHAIKDLSQEAWRENAILAKALLPKMQEYAATNIRECDGGNIFTKSLGAKASEKKRASYHLHTIVAPRTSIQPTPGTMTGNSSILLYDPEHLYEYLHSQKEELQSIIDKEQ